MQQNQVFQYLHGVLARLCAWYLYRYHIEPGLPGIRFKKMLKRVEPIRVGDRETVDGQVADHSRVTVLHIDPKQPGFQHQLFTRWLVAEQVKAMRNPEQVETVEIVFYDPRTK